MKQLKDLIQEKLVITKDTHLVDRSSLSFVNKTINYLDTKIAYKTVVHYGSYSDLLEQIYKPLLIYFGLYDPKKDFNPAELFYFNLGTANINDGTFYIETINDNHTLKTELNGKNKFIELAYETAIAYDHFKDKFDKKYKFPDQTHLDNLLKAKTDLDRVKDILYEYYKKGEA